MKDDMSNVILWISIHRAEAHVTKWKTVRLVAIAVAAAQAVLFVLAAIGGSFAHGPAHGLMLAGLLWWLANQERRYWQRLIDAEVGRAALLGTIKRSVQ